MPVEAVRLGGRVLVISASSTAYRGISGKSLIAYLCLVSLSTITEARVVSLPVPAVVGMARRVGMRCLTRRIPPILDRGFFGFAILAPTAFAVSMEEPPPRAMRESQFSSR